MSWRYRWKAIGLLSAACCAASLHLREDDDGSGSGASSMNSTDSDIDSPPLSREAIANISASGLALLVMGSALCYLLMCFNREERMQRVRMAQERNRQITRQMEAAKQQRRAQQAQPVGAHDSLQSPIPGGRWGEGEEEAKVAGALLFSQVHRSMEAEDAASHDNLPYKSLVSSSSMDNS